MNSLLNTHKKIWLNCIIFIALTNYYGHPHDVVLNRLKKSGARISRTDMQGTITAESDVIEIVWNMEPYVI